MKRSDLYEKVWTVPMIHLAKELGVSDVGLAKACRRNAIPTPPRGYWMKLASGKQVDKPPLPKPETDTEVEFSGVAPEVKAHQQKVQQQKEAWLQEHAPGRQEAATIKMLDSLEDAHALVKSTARFCERIPTLQKRWERRKPGEYASWKDEDRPPHLEYGRHQLFRKGCLNITAALSSIDWILTFHATLFVALERAGFKISWKDAETSRNARENKPAAVTVTRKGECFELRFSEGYRRVPLTAAEVAAYKKQKGYAPYRLNETVPSEKYTVTFTGSEYRANKAWQASRDGLERRLAEIVRTIDELATLQPLFRKEREEAAARAQRDAEQRERTRRATEARANQLKRAFAMAEAQERVDRLHSFLDSLERRGTEFQEPYRERLKVWLTVVRSELGNSDPIKAMLTESLSVPSSQTWPPEWWPEDLAARYAKPQV
ncbi:hypothetical protein D9M73_56880 [compost metagenome]